MLEVLWLVKLELSPPHAGLLVCLLPMRTAYFQKVLTVGPALLLVCVWCVSEIILCKYSVVCLI